MKPFRDVLERYDVLWEQAEIVVETCLGRLRRAVSESNLESDALLCDDASLLAKPFDMKEFNTVVTLLKRIQDARRAIHRDMIQMQPKEHDTNGEEPDENDFARISRVRRRLEEEGDISEDLEDEDSQSL